MNKLVLYFCFISLLFTSSCTKEANNGTSNPQNDYKTLGSSAKDFLSAQTYTSLTIEVSYMTGYAPGSAVLDNLKSYLNTYLNKPTGINIIQKEISPSGSSVMSSTEIAALEKNTRTVFTGGNTLTAHILIVDTDYDQNKVLGISYWNTSMCLFGKTVFKNSGGVGQVTRTQLFTTLLQHEFGHLLGLVNGGTPMVTPHEDAPNPRHCNNKNCLMYNTIETSGILSGSAVILDANCAADLKANGGK